MSIKKMDIKKIGIKKPRVALLIDTWFPIYSGEQIHVAKLAAALAEQHGYEVDIISCGKTAGLKKEEKDLERIAGVHVKRFCRWRGLYLFTTFFYLLVHGRRYNLTHAHSTLATIAMKTASWFNRVPTVVTVHASQVFQKSWTLRKILDRVMFLETKYSQEITVSEGFLKARNINEHVLLIPNGIDTEPFDLVEIEKDLGRFNVIFVGRLVDEKGVDVLLKATKKLIESNEFIQSQKDFVVHLVGEGADEGDFKKMAVKLNIEKYVRFHGKVTGESLVELYKSADLFVLPSRFEGLPMTLLEACAAKLPILATDVGDNKKLVLENVNGHLVQPDDVDELAYYLAHFALNPGLEQMGEASYDLVKQEYSWDVTFKKILRVYEGLKKPKRVRNFMPWQVPALLRPRRGFKSDYKGKKSLKFCFTVNVERTYEAAELPHEVEHVHGFLERLSEFCDALEIPGTIFVQSDLLEPHEEELKKMQKAGHELAVKGEKTVLRSLKDADFKDLRMFRSNRGLNEGDLKYIHEFGFEFLPTSEDPQVKISWRWGLPFGHTVELNLKEFVSMSEEEVLETVNRLRVYQKEHDIDPYLIFECSSWEFQSRDHAAWASGENFTKLSRRIAFLKDHMKIEFQTLSDFCKSCRISE